MLKTVFENDDVLCVIKPKGIPTVPLNAPDTKPTLLSLVLSAYPSLAEVKGFKDWEGPVLHRLDTATGGLVLFAKTQEAFNRFALLQKQGKIVKTYKAEVKEKDCDRSWIPCPYRGTDSVTVESFFRPYGEGRKEVRPCAFGAKNCGKTCYRTQISIQNGIATCRIANGFRHQIRAHLAWLGYPIKGDKLYAGEDGELMLDCVSIAVEGEFSIDCVLD